MNTRTLDVALRIRADLGQAATEVAALDGNLDGLKTSAQGAAKGLDAAATAAGKNTAADQANATAAKAAAVSQTALGAATQKTAATQQLGAISAKQHAQAMRQLPAQITDIVTGLASGQSVFMVAIQQGGQLKDSFGGIGPASKALLGAISPMFLAVSAGAATFAALGLALHQVYEEEAAVTAALLKTGNYAGTSAQGVDALVETLNELDGVTRSGAREALLAVAESGRIAGDQFERVSTVAARMQASVGQSIDTTVQKFEAIAKDPVDALLKLNETEHFLTAAQLERVRALVEEGREQDAAAEGARIYADRLDEIANAADAARPHLAQMWREFKQGADDAWEGTKNVAEFLAASSAKFNQLPWYQKFGPTAGFNFVRSMYSAEPAAPVTVPGVAGAVDSAEEKRRDDARKKAEQEWARLKQSNLSKQQKLEAEIVEIRKTGTALGKSDADIEAQVAQARARYKESLPKGRQGEKTDAEKAQESAQRELENLTKQAALLGTVAEGEKRVSEEARVRYEVENGAYKLASASVKQQLIDQAKRLDVERNARAEAEKSARADDEAHRAYERLADALRTPIEAAIDQVTTQIQILNKELKSGRIDAEEYQRQVGRVLEGAASKAPKFQTPFALQDDLTGLLGDQARLDDYLQRLDGWYADQQAIIAAGRASNSELNAQWDALEERTNAEHAARLQAATTAQHQMQLAATSAIFGSMAQIAYNAAGEQSRAYQALFALSKGFAVAQASIGLGTAMSNAMATGITWADRLAAIAQVVAQFAQITSIIAGANFRPAGYADGGWTGHGGKYEPAGIVHKGEGVLNQEEIRALGGPDGFYALRAAIRNGYADGGMVAPMDYDRGGLGARLVAPPQASPASLQSDMTLYLLQDRDALARALASHPAMRKAIVAEVSDNGNAIQASWSN